MWINFSRSFSSKVKKIVQFRWNIVNSSDARWFMAVKRIFRIYNGRELISYCFVRCFWTSTMEAKPCEWDVKTNVNSVCCSWFPETLICDYRISFTNFDLRYWRQTINQMQWPHSHFSHGARCCAKCFKKCSQHRWISLQFPLVQGQAKVKSFTYVTMDSGNKKKRSFRIGIEVSNLFLWI